MSSDGPLVSLTTYGRRARSVHLAIESIASGHLRPSAIVLWLDDPRLYEDPPPALRRLVRRGLDIRLCNPIGSHAKYYPAVTSGLRGATLVTADDDIIYPRSWLRELVLAEKEHPHDLICFRAKGAVVRDGKLQPYVSWPDLCPRDESCAPFALGVHGVLYPSSMVDALKVRGAAFLRTCPRADDVWINVVAQETEHRVRVLWSPSPGQFRAVRGMRSNGRLSDFNVEAGGNDQQLRATLRESERARLKFGLSSDAEPVNDSVDGINDLGE